MYSLYTSLYRADINNIIYNPYIGNDVNKLKYTILLPCITLQLV